MMFTKSNCLIIVSFILLKVVLISSLPTNADYHNRVKRGNECSKDWVTDPKPSKNCTSKFNESFLDEIILKNFQEFGGYFNQFKEIYNESTCISKCGILEKHNQVLQDKKITEEKPMEYDNVIDRNGNKLPIIRGYYIAQTKTYKQNLKQKICKTGLSDPSCTYMTDTEFRKVVVIDCSRESIKLIAIQVPYSVGCSCCS